MINRYNPSLYNRLKISDNSDIRTVKKAYRKLVFKYHPDTGKQPSSAKFMEVTDIYKELSDPIKKENYDLRLKTFKVIEEKKANSAKSKKSASGPKSERNWKDINEERSNNNRFDLDDVIIGGAAIVFSALVLNQIIKHVK